MYKDKAQHRTVIYSTVHGSPLLPLLYTEDGSLEGLWHSPPQNTSTRSCGTGSATPDATSGSGTLTVLVKQDIPGLTAVGVSSQATGSPLAPCSSVASSITASLVPPAGNREGAPGLGHTVLGRRWPASLTPSHSCSHSPRHGHSCSHSPRHGHSLSKISVRKVKLVFLEHCLNARHSCSNPSQA